MKNLIIIVLLFLSIPLYSQYNNIEQSIISTGIAYDNEVISTIFVGGRLNNFEMGLNYTGNFTNYNSLGATFNYYIPLNSTFELLFGSTINNVGYSKYNKVNYIISGNIGLGYKITKTWKLQIVTSPIRSISPIISSFGLYYSF